MTKLTTHVLDTMHGTPAIGMAIRLFNNSGDLLKEIITNEDGRIDGPVIEGEAFKAGQYRLDFFVGAYYRAKGIELPDPAFLEVVPIAFGVADPSAHYHVPLLVSPYGYSTYRGS